MADGSIVKVTQGSERAVAVTTKANHICDMYSSQLES